jgi:hypothetical protein
VETDNITLFYNYSKRVWGKALLTGMKGKKRIESFLGKTWRVARKAYEH